MNTTYVKMMTRNGARLYHPRYNNGHDKSHVRALRMSKT